jgi:hypothetical protein
VVSKKFYGMRKEHCELKYDGHYISDINCEDEKLIETLVGVMEDVFDKAEEELEHRLYKMGYILLNSYLTKIEDAKTYKNELVKEYLVELEEKYR